MIRFNPKSFAQPDLLKTIQPGKLIRLLEPCRQFLEERGLLLPLGPDPEIDYMQLSLILAQPDEFMPRVHRYRLGDQHLARGARHVGAQGA